MPPKKKSKPKSNYKASYGLDKKKESAFAELKYLGERNALGLNEFGIRGDISPGDYRNPELSAYLKAPTPMNGELAASANIRRGENPYLEGSYNFEPTPGTQLGVAANTDREGDIFAKQRLMKGLTAEAALDSKRNWEAAMKYNNGGFNGKIGVKNGPNRPNPYYSANMEYTF